MAKTLVIVESPAKAKTIEKFLGKSHYTVKASVGHVRDLPKSKLGVDIENNFEPQYINIRGKGDVIKELKKEAKKAKKVYLATDPDREGEAISWHLAHILSEYKIISIKDEENCKNYDNIILNDDSIKVIDTIKNNGILHIDEICDNTKMEVKYINAILNELVLKDLLIEMNNQVYSLNI